MFSWHCYYFQSFNFIVFCLVQLYNRWGNAVCHGRESDIREGHKSFPSGHTSCKLRTVVAISCKFFYVCFGWFILWIGNLKLYRCYYLATFDVAIPIIWIIFKKKNQLDCAKHLRNKVLSSSCWSVRLGTFQAQDSRCLLFYSSFPSSECFKEDTWMPCEM